MLLASLPWPFNDSRRARWLCRCRDRAVDIVDGGAIIEQGYADGSLRNIGSAEIVANGIFGVVGWTHRWYRPHHSQVSAEEIGATYAELILSGLENPYS